MDFSSTFTIPLHDKIKKIWLPPLYIWNRVTDKSSIGKARGDVDMINSKRFFGCKFLDSAYCVVSEKGYLVVYKDSDVGYAFDLTAANYLDVKEKADQYGNVKKIKVVVRFDFGTIILRFKYEPELSDIFLAAFRSPVTKGVFTEEYCNRQPSVDDYVEDDDSDDDVSFPF